MAAKNNKNSENAKHDKFLTFLRNIKNGNRMASTSASTNSNYRSSSYFKKKQKRQVYNFISILKSELEMFVLINDETEIIKNIAQQIYLIKEFYGIDRITDVKSIGKDFLEEKTGVGVEDLYAYGCYTLSDLVDSKFFESKIGED